MVKITRYGVAPSGRDVYEQEGFTMYHDAGSENVNDEDTTKIIWQETIIIDYKTNTKYTFCVLPLNLKGDSNE